MKRWLIFLGVGSLVILAGMYVLWLTDPSRRVNMENFKRIRSCATRQEVIDILGEPHFRPGEIPGSLSGTLTFMKLEEEGEVWAARESPTQTVLLYVSFDGNGTITNTGTKTLVGSGDWSILDRIRRWLRF
jgi:hypothetical protein